jgi:hypothetical protein
LRKHARTGRAEVLLATALALLGGACNLVFGLDPLTYEPRQRINALADASDGAEDANDGATDRTILDATPDGSDAGDGSDAAGDDASDASDAESDSG